jgi:hypothetical protein
MGDEVTYSFLREHSNPPLVVVLDGADPEKNHEMTKKGPFLKKNIVFGSTCAHPSGPAVYGANPE